MKKNLYEYENAPNYIHTHVVYIHISHSPQFPDCNYFFVPIYIVYYGKKKHT